MSALRVGEPAEWTTADYLADAIYKNRMRLEKEGSLLRARQNKRKRKRGAFTAAKYTAAGQRARALAKCPWHNQLQDLCTAAHDGSSLDAAFGKAFWHPGSGLPEGKQWVWW